jgi:hypothetical protein
MAGFIRRYGFSPGVETITLIEGVVIVDLPPPGAINGISTGTVGMVGEFPDMTYATAVDSSGVVTTRANPVEVFSGQDMVDKVGGFDSSLGQHGNNGGNGFVSLRNKKFSRLILAPVNFASAGAGRAWRDLPTNLSATQATPVVPLQGGRVEAGREFKSGVNRVNLGMRVGFTALGHFKNATDGAVVAAGPAVIQTFTSPTGNFLLALNGGPVKKGTILVLGVISGAGALGANAFTYRVTADAVLATDLIVEKLDGAAFTWTTGGALPYRLHPETDADTGGTGGIFTKLSDASGYTLPCRPITATIALATSLAPTVVPPAGTASTWDTLSGLTLRSHVTAGFVYDANVQAPNAPNHASIDALYVTAFDAFAQDLSPARDVNIIFSSRTSSTIRSKVKSHVLDSSVTGLGRMGVISPNLQTVSVGTVVADADPGVGANRAERVIYSWPGARTYVPEAANLSMGTADGLTTTDGILDVPGDGWMAAVLSNLPPERNPGQSGPPVDTVLSTVIGLQRGLSTLGQGEYINLRATGVAGLRIDRTGVPGFQSGITTSLTSGQKNINRRRMADFIQDSVSQALIPFVKQPLTQSLKDSITGQIDAFLNTLKSPTNPSAQRIVDYSVDDKSGNTPALEAQGIFVVIGRVRTLATADFIVFQTEVGEGVVVTTT